MTTTLQAIGDHLHGIDQVREENGVGMNKIDYRNWPFVSSLGEGRQALLLKKYKHQIESTFGVEAYQQVLAALPRIRVVINSAGEIAIAGGRLPGNGFSAYLNACKSQGCRYNSAAQAWTIQPGFSLDKFLETMEKSEIPVEVAENFGKNAAEREQKIQEQAQAREKSRKTVTVGVRRGEHGNIVAFSCGAFSAEFNAIFSNRSGILSGITEYDPQNHDRLTNSVRLAEEAIEKIKEKMPEFTVACSPEFEALQAQQNAQDEAHKTAIPAVQEKIAAGFTLFAHQNRAIEFLDKTSGNALIGACMGSGKTAITLAWCAIHGKRAIVVCPKVVRRTWCQEAAKFFPSAFAGKCLELKGRVPAGADLSGYQLATVNFEGLDKFAGAIAAGKFDVLVIDESHSIKNGKSKRAKACADLALTIPHHILLSGTAIKNSREELFPQLQIVNPNLYANQREILAETIGGFWHTISSCYLPMPKSEILRFLPAKIVQKGMVEVEEGVDVPDSIEEVARCKVQSAFTKVPATIEAIENILENSDEKMLVFSDSLEVCEQIFNHFGKDIAILHHGQMSDDKREAAKAQFQQEGDTHRVFVTTRQSLAVGATLTAANNVIFNDLPWNTADINQAEDRTHRIGQLKSVNVLWIVAENSEFDRHLCDILYRKYLICKAVNEGKQITQEERDFMEKAVSFADLIAAKIAAKNGSKKAK